MRRLTLLLLVTGCGPAPALLSSGSYIPSAPEKAHGLEGVNLTLDDGFAFFVTPDAIYERALTALPEEDWRTDCAKEGKPEDEGTPEQTFEVDPEPMDWPALAASVSTLSGACDTDGGMRLVGAEGAFDIVLVPF